MVSSTMKEHAGTLNHQEVAPRFMPREDRRVLRALLRLAGYVAITLGHVVSLLVSRAARGVSADHGNRVLMNWARSINRAMGLRVSRLGDHPPGGALLVSNHRSYIDITAIAAHLPVTFLAKKEVSRWPILGYGCGLVNVVFVDRDSPESRRMAREEVGDRLRRGLSIVVFPEGTSFRGPGLLSFRPGTFRLSSESGSPLVPVSIEYEKPEDAWVDDDSFLPHFIRTFSRREVRVTVSFGPVMRDHDPERLMRSAWSWIDESLAGR